MQLQHSFQRNLQKGFGLSLLILIISSGASYVSIISLKKNADWVNHTNIVLHQSEDVISHLKDAETGQRGYLLTGDEVYLNPYKNANEYIFQSLDSLQNLTKDNPKQQANCKELRGLIAQKLESLKKLLQAQKNGKTIDTAQLMRGQNVMAKTRDLVSDIQSEERRLLLTRTASLNTSNSLTPLVIIIAALLALGITFFFYRKVRRDYDLRLALQKELEHKDEETTSRIRVIENIATKISSGDYKIRLEDLEKDSLGKVSQALNNMALALDEAFEDLTSREWSKTGIAKLSDTIAGENNLDALCRNTISYLAAYTTSNTGAVYMIENDKLHLISGFAVEQNKVRQTISIGEGIAGECAASGKEINITDIPAESITLAYSGGHIKPKAIIAFPVYFEKELKAVIELSSLQNYDSRTLEFFKATAYSIGVAIESAYRRTKLFELFQETQAQAEELQAQHNELEQINAELEMQAQKLQASEEELKVQQEELMQSNQELEERSTLLEEKNQTIVERNLDIQKKAEEIEAATRYKSEFLANMSHELRTPLNSILLLARLLAENNDKNLTPEQTEFARVMQSSGNGLLTLIDEILDLSKIEAGKMKLEFEEVKIAEITENMTALFLPMAKEKNLKFEISVSPDVPETMVTDALRLEQILKNLFSNALKFTTRGAVTMHVAVKDGGFIRFIVKDTGIGIPQDKQSMVFEAFQQADGSTRRKYGGTGLGLSISRELAKLLGGEIKLQSEQGAGSEFTVDIPMQQSGAAVQIIAPQMPVYTSTFNQNILEIPLQAKMAVAKIPQSINDDRDNIKPGDKIILVIEDDVNFAKTLLRFAQQHGYKAIAAVQGDHGVQLAIEYKPMAILLDVMLPVKNGWQVMDELKSNAQTRHIPVHIMSSSPHREESITKGAIDFISKPVAFEKLTGMFEKIEQALTRSPKKILIAEENAKHAQALYYFLETYNINSLYTNNIKEAAQALQNGTADCVVLDGGEAGDALYESLEKMKQEKGLEHLPIIVFTGKNLSKAEEQRIKLFADSIVVKTANSYKRILDEAALFLHIVEENDPRNKKERPRKVNAMSEVLENKTVLIADDDVRNIFSLTKALEAHKMKVLTATDGKEALQVIANNKNVDIVLMDMMMPEMDGYEAIEAIRKIPEHRQLPVLAITAKAMYGDKEKCIQAGASDYIAKPVDIDQLTSLLRVWLYNKA